MLEEDPSVLTRLTVDATTAGIGGAAPSSGGELMLGHARVSGGGYLVPFEWLSAGVFTRLVGDLSLAPVNDALTQLRLRGSYPTSGAGDAMGEHRRVEAVVKGLLDSLSQLPPRSD